MTTGTTARKLDRCVAGAALAMALAATTACGPRPAANETSASTAVAAANSGGAGLGLGAYNGFDETGGAGGGAAGNSSAAGGASNATADAMSGLGAMSAGDTQAMSQKWAQATYQSCVPSAVRSGATQQVAQQYCTCVINQLDQLPVAQKLRLTPQSPELMQAANMCRPSSLQ